MSKAGRPTKYNEEVIGHLEEYTKQCYVDGVIPTVQEFAYVMHVNQDTIFEWAKRHTRFSESLKNTLACQSYLLQTETLRGKYNPAMAIFLLKNNHGFKDRTETDVTSNGKPIPLLGGLSKDAIHSNDSTKENSESK